MLTVHQIRMFFNQTKYLKKTVIFLLLFVYVIVCVSCGLFVCDCGLCLYIFGCSLLLVLVVCGVLWLFVVVVVMTFL